MEDSIGTTILYHSARFAFIAAAAYAGCVTAFLVVHEDFKTNEKLDEISRDISELKQTKKRRDARCIQATTICG